VLQVTNLGMGRIREMGRALKGSIYYAYLCTHILFRFAGISGVCPLPPKQYSIRVVGRGGGGGLHGDGRGITNLVGGQ
jgi:hypothetical protein